MLALLVGDIMWMVMLEEHVINQRHQTVLVRDGILEDEIKSSEYS
mgnify:CR=1 FL=1